jgi:hypothetical protein
VNVFVVERRVSELLVSIPHFLVVVSEDFAVQPTRHGLFDEEIHRFSPLWSHHERFSAFGEEEVY